MKKFILLYILLFAVLGYAQEQVLDKMELKNGKVYMGKVEKVKTDIIEFTDSETGLLYEYAKKEIRYIQLVNGKILTFEDDFNTWERPEEVQEAGAPVGLIILATVGVVLLVLLLIGAAAQ